MVRVLASTMAAAALAIGLVMLPVHRAMACSCAEISEKQATNQAAVVFEGVVVGGPIEILGQVVSSADPVDFEFAVQNVIKGGPLPDRIEVETARSGASCGAEFAVGQRWRVFAHGNAPDHLSSHLCGGNRLLDEQAPIPPSTTDDGRSAPDLAAMLPLAFGTSLLLIVGLLVVLLRSIAPR
jgi:hypothetical protein